MTRGRCESAAKLPILGLEASRQLTEHGAEAIRKGSWILYASRLWSSSAAAAYALAAELKAEAISLESEPPKCRLALIPKLDRLVRRWVSLSDYLLHVDLAIAACSSRWLKSAPLAVRMSFRKLYAPAEAKSLRVEATPQLRALRLLHEAELTPTARRLAELASELLSTSWDTPPQAIEEGGIVYCPEEVLLQVPLESSRSLLKKLGEALLQERMYSEAQQLAYRMLELGMLSESRELLAELAGTRVSYQAKLTLAILEAKAGGQPIAEQLLAELAQQPGESEAKVMLAAILARQGRLDEALELLEKARSENPRRPDVPYYIGNIMQLKGDIEKAIEEYTCSMSASPSSQARWMRGIALAKLGKLSEARAELEEALREDPTAEGYCDLAMVALKQDSLEEAERLLTTAIALDQSCYRAYMARGSVRARLGDLQGAYSDYRHAAELSKLPEAYANMALISIEVNQHARALLDLVKALKHREKLPDHGRSIEEAIERECSRMLAESRGKPARAALAAEAMRILAEAKGSLEEAARWDREAGKLKLKLKGREEGELYVKIAALNHAAGDKDRAERALEKAEETMPEARLIAGSLKRIAGAC